MFLVNSTVEVKNVGEGKVKGKMGSGTESLCKVGLGKKSKSNNVYQDRNNSVPMQSCSCTISNKKTSK